MRGIVIGAMLVLAAVASACGSKNGDGSSPPSESWTLSPATPVIGYQDFGGAVWNDPSVLYEGSMYRMWLSNGTGPSGVKIHEADSTDGVIWNLAAPVGSPQIVPGPNAFDLVSVETPAVVKVGATYHLYYTAVPDNTFVNYSIGHATSPDGITWTKDATPVIAKPTTPNEWGWLGVAEPGITYANGTFYLYYAMVRCREGWDGSTCTGPAPVVQRGIGLATSTDGTTFTPDPGNPIVVQSASYPASSLYEGYSTPNALFVNGTFHLFYDVAQEVGGSFRQVAIAHATSTDGRTFTEVPNILVRNDWTSYELRSPAVVDIGGSLELFFAGNNGSDPTAPGFQIGIGRAVTP